MAAKNKGLRIIIISIVALVVLLTIAKMAGWIGDDGSIHVSVDKVSRQSITETVSANGKVQPEKELKMSADVSGEIVDLFVKEGDVVKKGMLLAKIKPDIYVSSLDRAVAAMNSSKSGLEGSRSRLLQAQSQFEKAQLAYNRNKKLFDDGVISASDFENIKSSFEVAKAEVEAARQGVSGSDYGVQSAGASVKEAQENLSKTSIYAPVDGTISKLSKEKGERVVGTNMMEGTEIMRIANLNEMEVNVDVGENDIVRVHLGDTSLIDIDAYLDKKFKGVVTEVANSANTSVTTATDAVTNFNVKIRILRDSYQDLIPADHPEISPFRPGMSATVDIQTRHVDNVLSVPISAVTTRDTSNKESSKRVKRPEEKEKEASTSTTVSSKKEKAKECVFVLEKDVVKMLVVKTGIQDNTNIQIKEGLIEGQEVVTAPYDAISKKLKEGAKVKVVPKDDLFKSDKK